MEITNNKPSRAESRQKEETMSTKKERMMERIKEHGENLNVIFPNAEKQGAELCKALRLLEGKASRNALLLCNGCDMTTLHECENSLEALEARTRKLLGVGDDFPLFINRDPRGYALKILDEYVRDAQARIHTDWGGYGILAPDLTDD